MKDVVIVGGGVAGLAAGWRLRHWDTVLLESGTRVGGRVRSERRGPYFMNWGGHVYAGGNSSTAWLLNDTGVDSVAVPVARTLRIPVPFPSAADRDVFEVRSDE